MPSSRPRHGPRSREAFITRPCFKKLNVTCGNCQLLCHPDRDERTRRYKLLTKNGVVVQNSDGSLEAVPPDVAKQRLAAMPPERRAMYERD